MSLLQRLSPTSCWPVYETGRIRALEALLLAQNPTPLMQQAGGAAAQLAQAIAPHANHIWVAAGPGNNGGDGLEAALQLHLAGRSVRVSLWGPGAQLPADAHAAWLRAKAAGVPIEQGLPEAWLQSLQAHDLCIDALLGIGSQRPPSAELRGWVMALNRCAAQVLALDLPTGLNCDSGQLWAHAHPAQTDQPLKHKSSDRVVQADHTLSFVAAKPGLFMGHGRDACGQLWLASLSDQATAHALAPTAWLNSAQATPTKTHASHKGSHGDVAVIGGEALTEHSMGMPGAAVLAATAALHAGAGRTFLSLLSGQFGGVAPPDLMQSHWPSLPLESLHVVCGCGGGQSIQSVLPEVLRRSAQLVLDADGLNAVARDPALQALLRQRDARQPTVLTPHPLEAARLLNTSTAAIQNTRLQAAQDLAALFQCTVLLKGSGTVIAAPGQTPRINTTGNGRLATGGTGDVLAGLVGARMAQGMSAFEAACAAAWQHGQLANDWPPELALTASRLAQRLH